jgi:hypothetical protein
VIEVFRSGVGARSLGTGALVIMLLLGVVAFRQSVARREKKTAQERLAASDLEQGRAHGKEG